ncbi:hypothetical protein BRC81_14680 [Halobacteriales archaeon QS_1_68_20]|nr:MAG: hypothetical protein BRC81_14680 [Halobacteriales archaeon QS_1_68_20]
MAEDTQSGATRDGRFGDLPWRRGATRGAGAFGAALLGVGALVLIERALSGDLAGLAAETEGLAENPLYAAGWLFYNAHLVGVIVGGEAVNLVDALRTSGTVPASLVYAVPPPALYLAGNAVAHATSHEDDERGRRALLGATVVAGYLPLVLVGAVAFTVDGVGPSPVGALVFAGLGYPLVLGGLGGYMATAKD